MFRIFVFTLFLFIHTFAKADSCPEFFYKNAYPKINQIDTSNGRMLCFKGFAVMYNSEAKSAYYVAERTNRALIEKGFNVGRTDEFYEEARLPYRERALLSDYRRSGFDRGHLAPSADAFDFESMAQSFSLANIVPQDPELNRNAWADIEKAVRKYIRRAGNDVYIVTGPLYYGEIKTIGDGVWVPAALYKGVFDPVKNKGWVFVMENKPQKTPSKPISLDEFEQKFGIKLFSSKS